MREQSILQNFVLGREQEEFVLVTVTETEGSTYRKKGAYKIIDKDGKSAGLISGGCLEGEIVTHALDMKGDSSTHLIDTSADLDRIFGYAIGCQGKLNLSFNRIKGSELLTEECIGFSEEQKLKVLVFGAGPDIDPVQELLEWTKWDVEFFSERTDFVEQRMQQGWKISKFNSQELNFNLENPSRTAIVLMSHHYPADLELLKYFCDMEVGYIGLLGPRKKKQQMIVDLKKISNYSISENMKERFHGPLGIFGMGRGETAIALSLVAQLQSVFFNPELETPLK
jgi:xanthine dehydrogenase accessory factor